MTEHELASVDRAPTPFRHIAIAGTGRAGTSFLVRYLSALGMDTSLARDPSAYSWDEDANAGLEQDLASGVAGAMPYIVKSPWLFAVIDEVLARRDIALEAVIIPVRGLVEAASSRTIIERQLIHRTAPWMADSSLNWEAWGTTPGGIVYSLNPLDQARLLAVGFHKLLERLVAAEIPVVFLSFPRFTEDAAYLFRTLRPLLPPEIDETRAIHALAELADASKIRVGAELSEPKSDEDGAERKLYEYPSADKVDNIALRRELTRLRREHGGLHQEAGALRRETDDLRREADGQRRETDDLRREADGLRRERDDLRREADGLRGETDGLRRDTDDLRREADGQRRETDDLRREADGLRRETDDLRRQLDIVWRSHSWRLTKPLRDAMILARALVRQKK